MSFPGLEPTTVGLDSPLRLAQRYLASAYDSVASLVDESYPALRAQRSGTRGRLTHAEHDLFRAAVVFAGAGVDAVLKQALRSCVPTRLEQSDAARGKYVEFVTRHIQDGPNLSAKQLAELLTASSPSDRLQEAYVHALTGSSLQSREQVTTSLSALGLQDETDLYKEAKALDALFKARNQIAHEMDMTSTAQRGRGKRTRHERSLTAYESMCHTALNYCQRVLNSLEASLA